MKKLTDKTYGAHGSPEMTPFPFRPERARPTRSARHRNSNGKEKTNINVSCQDIRNLATTLYLTSVPGLKEYEQDYDYLIDEYYNLSNKITD